MYVNAVCTRRISTAGSSTHKILAGVRTGIPQCPEEHRPMC